MVFKSLGDGFFFGGVGYGVERMGIGDLKQHFWWGLGGCATIFHTCLADSVDDAEWRFEGLCSGKDEPLAYASLSNEPLLLTQ